MSTSSLNLGTTTQGTAGTPQSFTVSGSNPTADILLTAPSGVQMSNNGGTSYSTTLDLAESGGTVGTTTILARIAASAALGPVSGMIAADSTGATEQDISVSGTVNPAATTAGLTLSPASVQYSDVSKFTVTLSPAALGGSSPATSVQFVLNGSNVGTPQTLTTSAGVLTASLSPQMTLAPGTYTVQAVFGGTNSNFTVSNPTATLTVTREDARVYYTGQALVGTSSPTSTSANVTLSTTIKDITAVPGDPAWDPYPGNITTATVTFYIVETGQSYTVPVGLVNPSDPTVGTATKTVTLSASSSSSGSTYTIKTIVGGNYVDQSTTDGSTTTVTVAIPTAGSINGGGYIVNTSSSAGQYAGTAGLNTNFGLNVKYNKGGKNLQGNVNVIDRSNGHLYQFKSNALSSLTIPDATDATVVGKANVIDITNPSSPVSIDGNATMTISVYDEGEPGTNDKIAITVLSKNGGTYFSSNWNGTQTVEQYLGGGDIQIRTAQFLAGPPGPGRRRGAW